MIASWPFSAPAWPPETGASRKNAAARRRAAAISRASLAEAVVWSTTIAPAASAGSASATTWRTSSSLPTQSATSSRAGHRLGDRRGRRAAVLGRPALGLGGRAVEDGDVVAGRAPGGPAIGIAHHAQGR